LCEEVYKYLSGIFQNPETLLKDLENLGDLLSRFERKEILDAEMKIM